jgi:hypothetical protein
MTNSTMHQENAAGGNAPANHGNDTARKTTTRSDIDLRTDGGTDLVTACPECTHHNVRQRDDGTWRCGECEAEFSRPMRRARRHGGGNYSAAGEALRHADPDDLRTDGGVRLGAGEQTLYAAKCIECGQVDTYVAEEAVSEGDERDNYCTRCPGFETVRVTKVWERAGPIRTDGGQRDPIPCHNCQQPVARGDAYRDADGELYHIECRPGSLLTDGGLPTPYGLDTLVLAALFEGKSLSRGALRRQVEQAVNQEVDLQPVLEDLIADGYVVHGPEGGYRRTERGANLSHRIITTAAEFEHPADQTWRLDDDGWERVDSPDRPRNPDRGFYG